MNVLRWTSIITWCIPDEYIMEDANDNVEWEQKQEEDSSSMDTSSNGESPRSGEKSPKRRRMFDGTPTGIETQRSLTRQIQPPIRFRDYA